MIDEIIEFENLYAKNNYFGEKIDSNTFKICNGNIPILISAPHSVRQVRDGKLKAQDLMTGGIVDYIQSVTSCFSITNICTDNNDPNYDNIEVCKYKQEILNIINNNNIKLVLDFHGLDKNRHSLIDICTNNKKNLVNKIDVLVYFEDKLSNTFNKCDKYISIDKYFKADKEWCVSNCISRTCNIPCLELELNKQLRNPYEDEFLLKLFINTMIEIINDLKNKL